METRLIEVSVRGQEISCTVQHPYPRTNTVQYLHVHFDADAIWDPLKKIAVFRRSGTATVAVPLDETMMCEMPPQMMAVPGYNGPVTVHIGLIGVGEDGSRLTTGEVPVTVNPSCYTAGKTPHPPAPDVYEELLRLIREAAENDVEEIRAALDAYFAENPIDVSGKLDKNQGAENAGKVLGIDEDGAVVPVDAPTGNEGGIVEETDPTVPAWAKQPEKPAYTAGEVGADVSGAADSKVSAHNTSDASHNDIRLIISGLNARLNAIADSDDTTLDQLSEIVAYIKANKGLIDSITTDKVNVADIINNLTTSATNKPLSAKMGVELKALIDAIKIPTSLPASDVYAWAKQPEKPAYTADEVGAIPQGQLDSAVNQALAQAKESGEFDGAPGETGPQGPKGDPYTLTEADKAEIAAAVIERLGGNPIFGYVDEDNNIIVQGDLADGTYSVKYEMENGNVINIGNMVLDSNVYYSVTSTLTNCTINNSTKTVVEGGSYAATITAKDGYELKSLTVTMGSSPVTVSGGSISIASVTGDIVITAVAEEVKASYTNILTSGKYTIEKNKRWSNSSKGYTTCNGMIAMVIPIADVLNKTIYFKGFPANTSASNSAPLWMTLDSSDSRVSVALSSDGTGNIWKAENLTTYENDVYGLVVNGTNFADGTGVALAVNMAVNSGTSISEIPADAIMTIDEPIV